VFRQKVKVWLEEVMFTMGCARINDVFGRIFEIHYKEIPPERYWTWPYDARWAATELRKEGKLKKNSPNGVWEWNK